MQTKRKELEIRDQDVRNTAKVKHDPSRSKEEQGAVCRGAISCKFILVTAHPFPSNILGRSQEFS